ncbi:MAG TPA: transglycosylase domain-containing protein [Candidatus Sulfotelmatobacter sp.]|nr:transglycosylase domain-containing protein [Candidatus Sulfotelmatobacter sp.]
MGKNTGRKRVDKNVVSTKSGKTLKINRSLTDRHKATKAERQAKRAAYLSTLPKDRWKRLAYRMKPSHLADYWFSREGGIMALKIVGASIVVGFFLTIGLFAYFRKDLPQIKDLAGNLGGNISYYDSTGKVLLFTDYNSVKREPVASQDISPYMKEATVAIEDKNFYHEGAIDVRGIMRAAVDDLKGGGTLQGGSTITQQLVKLDEGWTDDRTITRKVKELILAVELERQYSKNDILTGYLNLAPYGGLDYGVQSAAQDYFQTDAKNLTLAQATMLAAIPQAPSYYSPYAGPQFNPAVTEGTFSAPALLARQHYILTLMVQQHYITQQQATVAMGVNVLAEVHQQQSKYQNIQAPYFVLAAKQQLINKYGASTVAHGGWKVITTLNTQLQAYAEQDVAKNARNVADVGGDEEAMVAENVKNGQVVAQVGGENFNNPTDGQINYTNIAISPGSSMKPFLYAGLIQNNTDAGAGSVLYDVQQPLPGYPCTNKAQPTATSNGGNCLWDDNFVYPGPETIRYALAGSRNVPAVKASYEIVPNDKSPLYTKSVDKWISLANSAIGVKNAYACYQNGVDVATATAAQQTQCYGSAAIGGGYVPLDQEVNGDSTLARLGQEIPQTYILSITDAAGKTVYQWHQPKATQVYDPDTAYIINSILDDPRATYLQPYQKFQNYDGWDIAVKTGTENQEYNGVMTAWSTQYAVIGFAGYHTLNQPLEEGHFEDITEPITRTWMEQALDALHTKPVNWVQPKNIKVLPGFVQRVSTGFGAEVPGPTDDLYPSWYAGKNSGTNSTEVLDKVSGLLATSCTPSAARETVYGGNDNSFSIDIFYPTLTSTAALEGGTGSKVISSVDNVHNCNDSPPSITLTAPSTCTPSCTITATVTQGTHPLSSPSYPQFPGTVTFSLGGQVIHTANVTNSPSTISFTYTPTSNGSASLSATVTDSVLYSATQSQNMSYGPAAPQSSGSNTAGSKTGSNTSH